jgi:hypothetical protein
MNKYLEKIASKKKSGQLTMRAGQKPIKHPKKPFVSLSAKVKIKSQKHGAKNGKRNP